MIKRIAVSLLVAALGVLTFAVPAYATSNFWYAGGYQTFTGTLPTGITANVSVYAPPVDTTKDAHSLTELAVSSGVGATVQQVEVFWSVDPARFPGANSQKPHLGTTIWINNVFQGYGATGFVPCDTVSGVNNCSQTTDVWDLNDIPATGITMEFGIVYSASAIWIKANQNTGTDEWLGYWPASVWTSHSATQPTTFDKIYAFGEVATQVSGVLGCSDMGDGNLATSTVGGVIGSVTAVGLATSAVDIDQSPTITDATKYNAVAASGSTSTNVRTFRYGGPGAC